MTAPPPFQTLLLDMDGVLAEVSRSYRVAIVQTCHVYGATSVTQDTITEWKAKGNANDDWELSYNLIRADPDGQNDVTLQQVTETFEDFYQGTGDTPGLYRLETLIPFRDTLLELKKRSGKIGIVTGRPRNDCTTFLKTHDLEDLIDAAYCAEDGPSKPNPDPVLVCCQRLGVQPSPSVVLVGDTPDDIKAAVTAGCCAVGVVTPEAVKECEGSGMDPKESKLAVAMKDAGAYAILPPGFVDLVDLFPSV